MRAVPATDELRALIVTVLLARCRPVDMTMLVSGHRSALADAYMNADPHLLVARCISADEFPEEQRPAALEALSRIRRHGAVVRRSALRVLSHRSQSLAKDEREKYLKAVATSYRELMEGGTALVRLGDPRLAELYHSRCA